MEVRRRTRPMVCFVNVHSVDRIIFSIFSRFNREIGKPAPSEFLHKQLDITPTGTLLYKGILSVLSFLPFSQICSAVRKWRNWQTH